MGIQNKEVNMGDFRLVLRGGKYKILLGLDDKES